MSAHCAGQRASRQAAAHAPERADPRRDRRGAVRMRATAARRVITAVSTAKAALVDSSAMARSGSLPPCLDGRSTIHNVT